MHYFTHLHRHSIDKMRWFDLYVEIDHLSDILLDARIKVSLQWMQVSLSRH